MQLPPLAGFRKETASVYGKPWSMYLKEHGFSLTLPPWSILLDDEDECAPHEESYRLALRVMDDLEVVREKAVRYLAQVVDPNRWGMHGAPYFNHVTCDAHENRVVVAMSWDSDIYSEWSVTFVVRTPAGAAAHEYHPRSMGYTTR